MSSILIADCGSSKTDWSIISPDAQQTIRTNGFNPVHQSPEILRAILNDEVDLKGTKDIAKIIFYGAGVKDDSKKKLIQEELSSFYQVSDIEVYSDLIAAAHATCGDEKGVCCILGTGSNSGYYNGQIIAHQNPSLGYIIGDEGSGTFLGKRVLQYFFYHTFDDDLMDMFKTKYGNDLSAILHKVYKEPYGNKYLASFTTFLAENRGHYMIENIIEDAFIDFHQRHILKYRQSWVYPIHFVGSVAYEFKDVLFSLQEQYVVETGKILKNPMSGLIDYHLSKMKN